METTSYSADVLANPTFIPSIGAVSMAGPCSLYSRGHRVHLIQMRVVSGHPSWKPATITEVEGNTVTFESEGMEFRLWNHDADLLTGMRDVAAIEPLAVVEWTVVHRLLSVTVGNRALVVYLSHHPHTECKPFQDAPPQTATPQN